MKKKTPIGVQTQFFFFSIISVHLARFGSRLKTTLGDFGLIILLSGHFDEN